MGGSSYEHVTIWEYDNMAAFQRAVEFLGSDERFARFVASRDRHVHAVRLALEPLNLWTKIINESKNLILKI